jgi:hypothetical protein
MLLSCTATILPVLQAETGMFVLHYVLMGASVSGLFTSILAPFRVDTAGNLSPEQLYTEFDSAIFSISFSVISLS